MTARRRLPLGFLGALVAAGLAACLASTPTGIDVAIHPREAQVQPSGSVGFNATVTGTGNTAVIWSVQEGSTGGTVTTSGAYTAPGAIGTFHVVATSQVDSSKSAVATVTVTLAQAVAVTISPRTAYRSPGQTASFSATVTGTSNTAVTWTVQEASGCGSITAAGLYTAPLGAATCHVVATSQADPSKSDVGTVTVTAAPASATPLAINIANDNVSDWSPELIFADAMQSSRGFSGTLDANGYPTGDATVVVYADQESYAIGTYKLSFVGQATVTGATVQNKAWNSATNVTTADVVADNNLTLTFSNTRRNPGDTSATGITNVKLIRPNHTLADTFAADFLARLNAGSGMFRAIRFMGFTNAIGSNVANWSDRTLPTYATQQRAFGGSAQAGAAWEYVIALCNQAGKDAWINVPYRATDDYVLKLAQAFLYGTDAAGNPYTSPQVSPVHPPLDPSLKIYVEFGNELWNWAFSRTTTNTNDAVAEVTAGDPYHYRYDGSADQGDWAYRRIAYKAKWHSDIFRSVFGNDAMMTRVRPILAGQVANSWVAQQGLQYLAAVWGPTNTYGNPLAPVNHYIYGIAGAPYVDVPNANDSALTVDTVITQMQADNKTVQGWITSNYKLCDTYDLKLLAYEGGQGLSGTASQAAKLAAQTDPRMQGIVADLLHNWFNAGPRAETFFYWNLCSRWNEFGYWGLSNSILSEATPKWEALKQIAAGM